MRIEKEGVRKGKEEINSKMVDAKEKFKVKTLLLVE